MVKKVCDAGVFCQNNIIGRCSADNKLLIKTVKEESEKMILKNSEFVYENDSNKKFKYLPFPRIRFSIPGTKRNIGPSRSILKKERVTKTLIQELLPVVLEKFRSHFREITLL